MNGKMLHSTSGALMGLFAAMTSIAAQLGKTNAVDPEIFKKQVDELLADLSPMSLEAATMADSIAKSIESALREGTL